MKLEATAWRAISDLFTHLELCTSLCSWDCAFKATLSSIMTLPGSTGR